MNWIAVGQFVVLAMGSAGVVKIFDALFRRRTVRVEVADKVNEMTLEWASAVRADAEAARAEASNARTDAAEARRQMAQLTAEIETATARLRMWRIAILHPAATLDGLRVMVSTEPGANGVHG